MIGNMKFAYDLWGDTVNTASRMESNTVGGQIQITKATYDLINSDFICESKARYISKGKARWRSGRSRVNAAPPMPDNWGCCPCCRCAPALPVCTGSRWGSCSRSPVAAMRRRAADGTARSGDTARDATAESAGLPGAPYPLVPSHGMAGFERIGPINYFYNVAADLRSRGEQVFESQVAPYDSSEVQGRALSQFIDQTLQTTGACKVNVIAHSQGASIAAMSSARCTPGDRIGALVTVGTPHQGTVVADVALGTVQVAGFTAATLNALLLAIQGLTSNDTGNPNIKANLAQLSTAQMATFNAQNPTIPACATTASRADPAWPPAVPTAPPVYGQTRRGWTFSIL